MTDTNLTAEAEAALDRLKYNAPQHATTGPRYLADLALLARHIEALARERDEAREDAQVARDCIIEQAAAFGSRAVEEVLAERERCARIAETTEERAFSDEWSGELAARTIAAAIRSGTSQE